MFYFLTVFRLLILQAININRPKPYRYLIQSHFQILTRKRNNIIFESYLLYVLESILIYFEVHYFFTFEFDKYVVVFFGFGIQLKGDQNLTMIHLRLPYYRICQFVLDVLNTAFFLSNNSRCFLNNCLSVVGNF